MRILIVEDEDSIRSALTRGLAQAGHQVSAAPSLASARAVVDELGPARRPECVVSDLKLPDGSGLDFARELGAPFLLMSGYATFDDAVSALRAGCLDFFTKPVTIRDIRRVIETLANRPTANVGLEIIDPEGGGLLVTGGRLERSGTVAGLARWNDPASAQTAWGSLLPLLPDAAARQVAAELVQAAPVGRLVVNRRAERTLLWLDAAVDWAVQPDRQGWLARHSHSVVSQAGTPPEAGNGLGTVVVAKPATATGYQPGTVWQGEVLWSTTLTEDFPVDLSATVSLGTWIYPWLRERPALRLVRATAEVQRDLDAAGLPLRWDAGDGVGRGEREMLLG